MKKKRLREFIALFQCLPDAELILSDNTNRLQKSLPETEKEICSLKDKTWDMNGPDDPFMTFLFDEIDDNLYKHPLNQREYIEDILIIFKELARFIDEEKYYKDEDENWMWRRYSDYGATRKLIYMFIENAERYGFDHYSGIEQYVIYSYCLMSNFFDFLDGRCIHFKLDLMQIQKEMNIFLSRRRVVRNLMDDGYASKIKLLGIRDEWDADKAVPENSSAMKALPPASAPEEQKINDFKDWLNHNNPNALAALCRELFNRRQSPKIYAVMVCLLCMKKIIVFNEKRRRNFYESWYAYINRPLPANNNYEAINKHLDVSPGINFINDTDPDYINLRRKFEKGLLELNKKEIEISG